VARRGGGRKNIRICKNWQRSSLLPRRYEKGDDATMSKQDDFDRLEMGAGWRRIRRLLLEKDDEPKDDRPCTFTGGGDADEVTHD
jgi:hypothetical protein